MAKTAGGVRSNGTAYSQSQIERTISDFVNGESSEINGWLRYPQKYSIGEQNRHNIMVLDSVLTGKVANGTLFRSTEARSVFGYLSQSEYENLYRHVVDGIADGGSRKKIQGIIGKTFTEKGYMSTSKSASIAEKMDHAVKPVMLRVNTNGRGKGLDLGRHSIGEEEVLLRRNTRYKIRKVYGKRGEIYVDVDIV